MYSSPLFFYKQFSDIDELISVFEDLVRLVWNLLHGQQNSTFNLGYGVRSVCVIWDGIASNNSSALTHTGVLL